jgi:dihydrofolate reductase
MRKLVESTFVTMDGVISDPGVWGQPFWDDDHAGYAQALMEKTDALLLGRKTYEGFAQAWPERSADPFTDKINAMPKYVASRTLKDATWSASIIPGDVAAEVRRLKEQPGEDLLKYGTGEFDRTLIEHNLVDEFHFWIFPIALGTGTRLFEGYVVPRLKLLKTTQFKSGIVVHAYAPA